MESLYNLSTDHAENSLYCCREVFTAMIAKVGRSTDSVERQLRDIYLVSRLARCLLPSNEI
jgi:hypothetical protein